MSLKEQTVSGVKWNTLATANNALVQIGKLMILARLLPKSDFGLIAIVLMLVGFFDIFASLGLSVGIIHKQNITREQYSSVFWINLIASIVIYGILCICSPLAVNFFHQDELALLIPIMGTQLIINAFGKMFFTFKTKELEFKFISIVSITGVAIGAIATIIMAYSGLRVYSLVYGMLIQSLVIQVTYAVSGMRKYRILFTLHVREIFDILKIGGYQVGTQVFDYISNKIDIFIIGRFFGMEMLGIYNLAKELVLKVIQVFNPIITNVATPAFSKIQDNLPLMQTTYLKILKFLSFVNFPFFIATFIFAEPITIFFYGQKMIEVAVFVRILALWGLFNSVGNPAGILMISLGRTDLGFYWTIVRIFITSAVILIASYFNIYAIAWSQVLIAFSFFFLYWRMMVYNMSKIPLSKYIAANGMSFFLSALSAVITAILLYFTDNLIFQYGIIVLYVLLYITFNFFFNKPFLMEIGNMVFQKPTKHFFIK